MSLPCGNGYLSQACQEQITDKRTSLSPPSFAQVMQRARLHDEEALVALYQRALPVIYRYVIARLGRVDLAEDVVSEVFLVMVESISDLRTDEEAGFYAWLLQIAQGKVSRLFRRLKQIGKWHLPLSDIFATDGYAPVEPMATDLVSNPAALHEWHETLKEVGLALGNLSNEQQMILVERFLGEQKIDDIAQALGKPAGTVRVLQFRALKSLAAQLGLAKGTTAMDLSQESQLWSI